MHDALVPSSQRLHGLKNISWLTARQLSKLAAALSMSPVQKRGIIFNDKGSPDSAYFLLAGIACLTCRNRKGHRAVVMMLAPGMIPCLPPSVLGINYNFRCEAVTDCQIGIVGLERLLEISLGQVASTHFKLMAANYIGQWDLVQLRCSNFMSCTLAERLALLLLELSERFGVRHALGTRLTVKARHRELADLLAASRPRVSEHLMEFESKNLITRRNRQFIVRRDRLESFLSASSSSH